MRLLRKSNDRLDNLLELRYLLLASSDLISEDGNCIVEVAIQISDRNCFNTLDQYSLLAKESSGIVEQRQPDSMNLLSSIEWRAAVIPWRPDTVSPILMS